MTDYEKNVFSTLFILVGLVFGWVLGLIFLDTPMAPPTPRFCEQPSGFKFSRISVYVTEGGDRYYQFYENGKLIQVNVANTIKADR